MNRRNALKLLGALIVCIGGTATSVKGEDYGELVGEGELDITATNSIFSGPYDYNFSEEGIRNITIERKNKPDLVIPFKDIVKALEED